MSKIPVSPLCTPACGNIAEAAKPLTKCCPPKRNCKDDVICPPLTTCPNLPPPFYNDCCPIPPGCCPVNCSIGEKCKVPPSCRLPCPSFPAKQCVKECHPSPLPCCRLHGICYCGRADCCCPKCYQ